MLSPPMVIDVRTASPIFAIAGRTTSARVSKPIKVLPIRLSQTAAVELVMQRSSDARIVMAWPAKVNDRLRPPAVAAPFRCTARLAIVGA
jgi:hypothetical protein